MLDMLLGRPLTMSEAVQERRAIHRFDMRLPAVVRIGESEELSTETQNVSGRGVFFFLDRKMDAGARVEMTLTFPAQVSLTERVRLRFTATVVRVEEPGENGVGIGATIEQYEFLRAGPAADGALRTA
jgi:hypothetical protein